MRRSPSGHTACDASLRCGLTRRAEIAQAISATIIAETPLLRSVGLFLGAELNDLTGVSVLQKPGTILGFPFQSSSARNC